MADKRQYSPFYVRVTETRIEALDEVDYVQKIRWDVNGVESEWKEIRATSHGHALHIARGMEPYKSFQEKWQEEIAKAERQQEWERSPECRIQMMVERFNDLEKRVEALEHAKTDA